MLALSHFNHCLAALYNMGPVQYRVVRFPQTFREKDALKVSRHFSHLMLPSPPERKQIFLVARLTKKIIVKEEQSF